MGNAACGGGIDDVRGAGAKAQAIHTLTQTGNRARHIKRRVVDGSHHQITRRVNRIAADFFLAAAYHHFINPAYMGRACFAKAGLHPREVLQLQSHMLHDVTGPSALAQTL